MTSGRSRRTVPQRGFALLIVLWTLVLVTLVVTQLGAAGRSEAQLARNLVDGATVEAAADGAVYEAVARLLDRSARHWDAVDKPYELQLGGARVEVRIEAEDGKIDPNASAAPLLQALLREVGADTRSAASLALAMVRWVYPGGPDQTPQSDAALYRAAGRDYAPPAAPFQSLDEIGLVLGMTPDLLARLRPHLTVLHEGNPDPRVADPVVAAALREQTGGAIAPPADDRGGRVFTIVAVADGANASRFVRRAAVRVGAAADRGAFRILQWH